MTQAAVLAQMGNTNQTFRNRIINGAMMIDQRNAGASVTPTSDGQYGSCDRWSYYLSQTSKFSVQQSSTAPTGFANSLLITSLSAYSVTGNDYFSVNQKIEGFNFADLMWGTINAQTVTVSFWVRSSLTGTFGGAMTNNAFNRSYPFSYTINSANTWEQKTVTISGDTTGTWVGATNGVGVIVQFGLGASGTSLGTAGAWTGSYKASATGATNVVGTNGATFYITGVQLEAGTTATPFEMRSYGTELSLCQRYLPAYAGPGGTEMLMYGTQYNNTTNCYVYANFPVTTRVAPTGITVSSASHFRFAGTVANMTMSAMAFSGSSTMGGEIALTGTGGSSLQGGSLQSVNAAALVYFTGCEL